MIVPIIIPYYRAPEKLEACLAAIKAQTYTTTEVFVRDNSEDNIYFTAAVNEGLNRYCCRDDVAFILVLNHDANLRPDALAHLVAFMTENPACGIACPLQVEGPNNRVTWGGSRQAFPFGGHRCDPFESYRAPFETFWANGAAMLIRASVIREIGTFDKNMKFLGSDADFSFTARSRGWKVMVVPQAIAEHVLTSSAIATSDEIGIMKAEDMIYFAEKWFTGDLYRSMAYEGQKLTPAAGQEAVAFMRAELRKHSHGS